MKNKGVRLAKLCHLKEKRKQPMGSPKHNLFCSALWGINLFHLCQNDSPNGRVSQSSEIAQMYRTTWGWDHTKQH
jgi:hypothetical protein